MEDWRLMGTLLAQVRAAEALGFRLESATLWFSRPVRE